MEHLAKKFKHQRKFRYLLGGGQTLMSKGGSALQRGLSVMSCKDLKPPPPFKVLPPVRPAYR